MSLHLICIAFKLADGVSSRFLDKIIAGVLVCMVCIWQQVHSAQISMPNFPQSFYCIMLCKVITHLMPHL